MAYWLLKSEPDDWSWVEQVAKGRDSAQVGPASAASRPRTTCAP